MEGAYEALRVIEDAVVDLKCMREYVHASLCWHASESSRVHIERTQDISRMQTRTHARTHAHSRTHTHAPRCTLVHRKNGRRQTAPAQQTVTLLTIPPPHAAYIINMTVGASSAVVVLAKVSVAAGA